MAKIRATHKIDILDTELNFCEPTEYEATGPNYFYVDIETAACSPQELIELGEFLIRVAKELDPEWLVKKRLGVWAEEKNKILKRELKDLEVELKKRLEFTKNLKGRLNDYMYKGILDVLNDSENTYNYRTTSEPLGNFQEGIYNGFDGIWVNQTTDDGMNGDEFAEFAGSISIKLGEGEYFTFDFEL